MTLATLPDSTVIYVVGHGEATLGEARAPVPQDLDMLEATYQMWEDIATRNLCRKPWQLGASVSDIKAYHAARYTSGLTRQGST